jgi:Nuclear cap-binding protein subunit 3
MYPIWSPFRVDFQTYFSFQSDSNVFDFSITLIEPMSLSACVTRILSLHGFPPELKTRDIQAAFAEYENERGGFKIKWIDDTSLLIVFNDAAVGE